MRQPFSGTAERIFMKFFPNDTGENGVCNVVPPPGESRAAAWRMANVDNLRILRYDSGAITQGRRQPKSRRGALSTVRGARESTRGLVWGGGIPLPSGGGVWEGGCAPSPENFLLFPFEIMRFDAFCNTFYSSDGV